MAVKILVTGASGGIGLAVVRRLVARSDSVVASGRNRERLELARQAGASVLQADLLEDGKISALVQAAGHVDAVIHAAGICRPGRSTLMTGQMLDLNFFAGAILAELTLARTIFVASQAGVSPAYELEGYAASKHAVVGYVKSARTYPVLAAVCSGFVDTPMVPDWLRSRLRSNGVALLSPETVAEAIIWAVDHATPGQLISVPPSQLSVRPAPNVGLMPSD